MKIFNSDELALLFDQTSKFKTDISSVSTDTRTLILGALFVPISGARIDSHSLLKEALNNGASCFLCSMEYYSLNKEKIDGLSEEYSVPFFLVQDTLNALLKMAKHYILKFSLKTIAITGSSGKTTCKELIYLVLSKKFKTFKNRGNFNSLIGLPLTIFEIPNDAEFGVFEFGINHIGEMEVLNSLLKPEYCAITNIENAHIGNFGSFSVLKEEKLKILNKEDLSQKTAFLHEDLRIYDSEYQDVKKIYYSAKSIGITGVNISFEVQKINLFGKDVIIHLTGDYNRENIALAATIGIYFGVSESDIIDAIESYESYNMRGETLKKDGVTFILDCYNANPDSMKKSILSFWENNSCPQSNKIVVLGDLKELGDFAKQKHEELGEFLTTLDGIKSILLFGTEILETYKILKSKKFTSSYFYSDKIEEVKKELEKIKTEGDCILLKGSRSLELERVI